MFVGVAQTCTRMRIVSAQVKIVRSAKSHTPPFEREPMSRASNAREERHRASLAWRVIISLGTSGEPGTKIEIMENNQQE